MNSFYHFDVSLKSSSFIPFHPPSRSVPIFTWNVDWLSSELVNRNKTIFCVAWDYSLFSWDSFVQMRLRSRWWCQSGSDWIYIVFVSDFNALNLKLSEIANYMPIEAAQMPMNSMSIHHYPCSPPRKRPRWRRVLYRFRPIIINYWNPSCKLIIFQNYLLNCVLVTLLASRSE